MALTIPSDTASAYAAYKTAHPGLINLVDDVRDWLNRDEDVVSNNLIGSFMQKAADNAYRELRIPPLETTLNVTVSSANAAANQLTIPGNFTELIRLSKVKSDNKFEVYNDRVELSVFDDQELAKPSYRYFTRKGTHFKIYPAIVEGEVYEIHYYRRLFALDALTVDTSKEIYNWLRDDNEKVFLFGTLKFASIYLSDMAAADTYSKLFDNEIATLNQEEKQRLSRGANLRSVFSSKLI